MSHRVSKSYKQALRAQKSFMASVASRREDLGWTQVQLGKKVGLTGKSISSLECGQTTLSVLSAVRIAKVMGISLDECFLSPKWIF